MRKADKTICSFLIPALLCITWVINAVAESAAPAPEGVEYKATDLRDPFQFFKIEGKDKPGKQELAQDIPDAPLPAMLIQGIICGGTLPQAIINNKIVKVGDTIEGAEVIEISKEAVIVHFGRRDHELPSPSMIIKRRNTKVKGKQDNQELN
jgi:hypothetical protein